MSPTLLPRRESAAAPLNVEEGVLYGGLPYLAVGQGPALVVLSGFSAEHANPTGAARRFSLRPLLDPADPADMLAVINAEDRFDAAPPLHRVTAPTLVVAGDRDRNYTPELFRETADRIPGSRLRLYPGKGHTSIAALRYRPAVREILGFLTAADTEP